MIWSIVPKPLPTSHYIQRYLQENYIVVGPPDTIKSKTNITLECPNKHQYSTTPAKWKLGRRCQKCTTPKGDRLPWGTLLGDLQKQGFLVEKKDMRIVGFCPKGHQVDADAYNLGRKLPICSRCGHIAAGIDTVKKHKAVFEDLAASRGFSVQSEYKGQHEQISLRCPNGHEYTIAAMGFSQGNECSACSNNGSSSPEREILLYVQNLLPSASVQSRAKNVILNPDTQRSLELDIYVPEKKLAIEFHGLYWHSSQSPSYVRGRSALKARLCAESGIKFLCLFEDEWINKKELIKSMIRYRLGLFSGTTFHSRKLTVKRLNKNKDFEYFFEKNHLDGHRQASFAIGLFNGGSLVQAASFAKTREGTDLECLRMATDIDFRVKGGAERIFAHVGGSITTYSNNRLSDGGVYRKLGFSEITRTSKPSYWYTEGTKRLWRFNCKRINTPEVLSKFPTEELQALGGVFGAKFFGKEIPLYKIEDCGHKKWYRDNLIYK